MNFPGKNTGVGCHSLLQGIFLTQGSNPCLLLLELAGASILCHCTTGEALFLQCVHRQNFSSHPSPTADPRYPFPSPPPLFPCFLIHHLFPESVYLLWFDFVYSLIF